RGRAVSIFVLPDNTNDQIEGMFSSVMIRTAIAQNRHSLRRFFCPRNTRIDANPVQVSREALWECGASSARGITRRPSIRELGSQYPMGLASLFASVRFDPKRHEDVSHSKCFAKSSKTSFLLAFIRVFRGLNFGCGGAALGNPWSRLFRIWGLGFGACCVRQRPWPKIIEKD